MSSRVLGGKLDERRVRLRQSGRRAARKPRVEALEADGFTVWWDAQIGGGDEWRRSIERELNAAKCVIVT